MTRKTAINIILILLAAILGVVGYKLSPLLRATGDTTLPVSTCNPSAQPCQVSLPNGGKVELSFAPRPIRPLQAFKAEMSVHDVKVSKAEIDFEGAAWNVPGERMKRGVPHRVPLSAESSRFPRLR